MHTQSDYLESAQQTFIGFARRAPVVLVRGEGTRVWDADGKGYLDFTGGIAVNVLGHAHPKLSQAICEQSQKLMHVSNLFYNDQAVKLAQGITKKTGFARAFFCNSGTEANEALIKLARRYHFERGDHKRHTLVTMYGCFHGRTMGALSITATPEYHKGFAPMMGGVKHVPFNDVDALAHCLNDEVAAVIVEPIQGEGGIHVAPDEYLKALRKLCDENGSLLMFDEVQTGVGRTGKYLAREWSGVWPDACTLGKGIGGGFPLAALLIRQNLADALPLGSHGTTYGGNPLACAAGLAVLKQMEEDNLVSHAQHMGEVLAHGLSALTKTKNALGQRGRGLLQGVILKDTLKNVEVMAKLRDAGLLCATAGGNLLRFAPPLNVTKEEVGEALSILDNVLASL